MKKRKIFVLDTCVLLYDHTAYRKFGDNNIVIPIATLEELDNFKKGNEAINYEARQFIRIVDKLAVNGLNNWTPIGGDELGSIKVCFDEDVKGLDAEKIFRETKADHRILNVALHLSETEKDTEVILVTKDVNLRVKAKALGVNAEDYRTGIVQSTNDNYTGKYTLTEVNSDTIEELYNQKKLPIDVFKDCNGYPKNENINNGYFIIRNGNKSALGWYNPGTEMMHLINKKSVVNITPRNAEQIFAIHAVMNDDTKIVSISGKAGTGKTLMALAAAIEQRANYYQIYIARPIVPLNNRDLGYLPGDADSKIGPYMEPIWDNLKFIKTQANEQKKGQKKLEDLTYKDKIVVTPLAFIRGRSFANILFIVDEAQNLSPNEIKTIITRIGENSKIIFTGDIEQIDTPYLDEKSSRLSYMIEKLKGEKLYTHITLEKGERSEVATLAAEKL